MNTSRFATLVEPGYTYRMEELVIGDKTYIPSKKAAEITGYAKDYIGQLCREGRVEAKLVGRSWYVLESSIREHRFGGEAGASETAAPEAQEAIAVTDAEDASEHLGGAAVAEDAWETATYTPEPLEEIVPVTRPTFIENKPQIDEAKVADLQQSWEAWFSKPASVPEESEEAVLEPQEASEEPMHVPEEAAEPEEVPVAVTRRPEAFVSGHMDIAPARPAYAPSPVRRQSIAPTRRSARPTREERRKGGGLILKAAFVAVVVITVAVSVIGLGFFDGISGENQFAAPIIDFISGVERADKR